ncbi:MAG: universal stress protein [Pseudomonadota bacterium]
MYNNILVPVVFDHGDRANNAVAVAQKLLAAGGKLTLLHVIEELPSYASSYLPAGLHESHVKEALSKLDEIARSVETECHIEIVQGHASSSILDYSKSNGLDCVVIASHKPGLEDYFLGSTAARVVRYAQCGVHILR